MKKKLDHFPSPSTNRCHLLTICLLLCAIIHSCNTGIARKRLHRAKAEKVPNCYFVHFKRDTSISEGKQLIDEVKRFNWNSSMPKFSATIQGILTKSGHGFAAKMSDEALKFVVDHDKVNFVEEDSYIRAAQLGEFNSTNTRVTENWGIDRMDTNTNQYDGHYTPPCGLTGRGVDVYVVDSGLYYEHLQFGGRAVFSGCDSIDVMSNTSEPAMGRDCGGHGTTVAGVIGSTTAGVAPGVNLLSVRALACDRTGSWNSILLGLECIIKRVNKYKNRSAVVNLSVTGASKNRAIKRAIDKLIDSGITVVGISGNSLTDSSGNSCKTMPGSIPGVITVAGSTREDEIFNQTLLGRCVDILAPGKNITSTCSNWINCTESKLHGSSFAGPHVTGAIALLLEKCPKLSPWKVRYYLQTKMAVPNMLHARGIISTKYQRTTPNLLVHTGPEMCSIVC